MHSVGHATFEMIDAAAVEEAIRDRAATEMNDSA
jgi:hypothetical protein